MVNSLHNSLNHSVIFQGVRHFFDFDIKSTHSSHIYLMVISCSVNLQIRYHDSSYISPYKIYHISKLSFFHFSRNSLPQVHVFFRAQEKISSLRKKSSSHFLVLKTHATPISAHFEQNTPKNVRKKISLGKFFSQNFLDGLRGQKNTKKFGKKISLGKEMGNELPQGRFFPISFPREIFFPNFFSVFLASFWPRRPSETFTCGRNSG